MTGSEGVRARARIDTMQDSLIRQIADAGHGRNDLIALWFGESDEPTPEYIRRAAARAMDDGHTLYPPNRGIAELAPVLSDYMTGLHGLAIGENRITVTASAMNGIMLIMQMLIDPGDNIVMATPLWPNCAETVHIMGGETRRVRLDLENGRWRLDLDRLIDCCDRRTKAIFVNSPGNPTGWVMDADTQRNLLEAARARGLMIIADEVYERICFTGDRAPSFLDIVTPEDPVIVVNSFSKSWSMTGWRLGWLTHPPALGDRLGMLTEFNIAGPTTFVQHAGVAAISGGDAYIASLVARYAANRDLVCARMADWQSVQLARPDGAFYAFFSVNGANDSVALAHEILDRTGVGVAPGAAFGPEGEGWLRLCFGVRPDTLARALDRLEVMLGNNSRKDPKSGQQKTEVRRRRSAAALRENLRRRKAAKDRAQ
ncbi:MAG: pyridoxal phosphate-dependent aminotransferase [Alphaproteobacteria bacterium]|nr:pyridoxal phosphate-dependent aminotransferase [Alphaproteobacteria bacterium]MCZ6763842.1 pyridoxal phosphate-dependent aminotransferase [Alphaproteobacteria bacterium]